MTKISKDGGVEGMVATTSKPIRQVERITIKSLQGDEEAENNPHRITYGGISSGSN